MRPGAPGDAEDLTQGFFTMLIERVDFASLSPERGSFRGFLKTALRRFVIGNDRRRAARAKYESKYALPFDGADVPDLEGMTPDEAFDRRWAHDVVQEML